MALHSPALLIITRRMFFPGSGLIEYPVIVGMFNMAVQKKINDSILFVVNKLYFDQINKLKNDRGYVPPITVNGWYELKTNESDVLSLSIGNYTIAHPAANGWTIMKSLTFDTKTGALYQLNDLFKPDSNYRQVLSDIISAQIKSRSIPLISPYPGIKPVDQDYYIADKALVIYYQPVEFTPHVYGFPMFPISVYEIQDLIKPGTPLDKMLYD